MKRTNEYYQEINMYLSLLMQGFAVKNISWSKPLDTFFFKNNQFSFSIAQYNYISRVEVDQLNLTVDQLIN